ncbi:carbohydrate-binding protein, partial [Bacteroides xylanisolvens]
DYMIEHHGCENWGIAPNWFYEWTGWGTLTKRLTPWMAGDPVSFSTGKRVSGIHLLPCEISAADYDYYCLAEDPEGHTYHNVGKKRGNEYRPDGAVELRKEEDNYVVTQIEDGEWMNYTVSIPTDGDYTVYLVYQSKGNSLLSVASDSEVKTEPMQLPSSIQWTEREIGKLTLPAGACVLRLQIEQAGDKLEIQKIIVK